MIKNLLTGFLNPQKIGTSVNKFGQALPGRVSDVLDRTTASRGATAAPPEEHRYSGTLRLRASITEALAWLDRFAMLEIESSKWTKTASMITPAGPGQSTAFVQYKSTVSMHVPLTPRTWRATFDRNLKSQQKGYNNCVEAVSYEYVVRFVFTGGATETRVEYLTIERIDPGAKSKRDLVTHYAAPTMPQQFGAIGEQFLRSVSHASF
jgi:hypothetical protein